MKRRLIVSDGQRERELLLVGTIVVGRDPACDVSEDGDSLLSRRHSEFVAGPDGVVVRDLGSRNGTFVNGVRIAEGSIRPGDVVHIGHLRLRYIEGDEPASAGPAAAPSGAGSAGVQPAGTVNEDDQVTRIIQSARQVPPSRPVAAADEDDRTVVTPRPGAAPPPVAPAASTDDERTVFVTSGAGVKATDAASQPVAAPPARSATAAAARTMPAARPTPATGAGEIQTFVAVQVFGVAAIAVVALVVAVITGRAELGGEGASPAAFLKWLGLPAAIAAVAAWRASRAIARRIARTLTADNEEGLGV